MGITKNGQKFHTLAHSKTLHVLPRFLLHALLLRHYGINAGRVHTWAATMIAKATLAKIIDRTVFNLFPALFSLRSRTARMSANVGNAIAKQAMINITVHAMTLPHTGLLSSAIIIDPRKAQVPWTINRQRSKNHTESCRHNGLLENFHRLLCSNSAMSCGAKTRNDHRRSIFDHSILSADHQ